MNGIKKTGRLEQVFGGVAISDLTGVKFGAITQKANIDFQESCIFSK